MLNLYVKVVPGGDQVEYGYPLGRGFVKKAERIARGIYRFWFSADLRWQTFLVSVAHPWSEERVDLRTSVCREHGHDRGECLRVGGEEGAPPCVYDDTVVSVCPWRVVAHVRSDSVGVVTLKNGVEEDGAGFDLVAVGSAVSP